MNGKLLLLFCCLLAIIPMSGCTAGTAHVAINRNGSVDVTADVSVDKRLQLPGSAGFADIAKEKAGKYGFELTTRTTEDRIEYGIARHFASFKEIADLMPPDGSNPLTVERTTAFFYTKLKLSGTIDVGRYTSQLAKLPADSPISAGMLKLILSNTSVDFKLTLPINTIGHHNADAAAGRTLTWNIPLAGAKTFELEFYVPDVKHIVWTAVPALLVLLAVALFLIVRIKRKRRPA